MVYLYFCRNMTMSRGLLSSFLYHIQCKNYGKYITVWCSKTKAFKDLDEQQDYEYQIV